MQGHENTAAAVPALMQRARELSRELLLVDTHVDLPYRLTERQEDVSARTEGGDFDYPRAIEGGLDVPFMSIYVPASFQQDGGAAVFADEMIDMVQELAARHPDKFTIVRSVAQARGVRGSGKLGLGLGIENGAAIEGSLQKLKHFHDRGVRYITLTHSENNRICDSSYAEQRRWNGLSPFGRTLIEEMNRLGVMVDVSHVSDETFHQVMQHSRAPVIASHSSCRHFTPGFERNMDDEMIRKLAEGGGVIQINFGSGFLLAEAHEQSSRFWKDRQRFLTEHGHDESGPDAAAFGERYWQDHPRVYADVSDVAEHIDHVVRLVGVDHVGLGSDFDGVGDSLPTRLKDVSQFPNLIHELLVQGYAEPELRKICSGNFLRVWAEVERIAGEST